MRFMQIEPYPSGAYSAIHERDDIVTVPSGCYEVADGVTLTCHGFGTRTIENGVVTAFIGNEVAYNAWKAEQIEPTPEPTETDRITALEATQSDVIDVLASALGVTI